MDIVRSSIVGGLLATGVLLVFLLVADFVLAGTNLFVFATFTGLCAIGGPPYCTLGSPTAIAMTFVTFGLLFGVAWPLLFGGFTWGLPGESGAAHGAIFGVVLWIGYAAVVFVGISIFREPIVEDLGILGVALMAYLLYGTVLGVSYDYFADHRTFLTVEEVT